MARKRKVMRFGSRKAYLAWLAYGHIRSKTGRRARTPRESVFATTPGHVQVFVRGKPVKVHHRPWKGR